MKGRTIALTVIVVAAVAIVFFWNRRERENELAELERAAAASGSTTGASTREAMPPPDMRKLDKAGRDALQSRIAAARTARTGGAASAPAATSAGPRPSLPPLTGTLKKDDIRNGVRAVIPLLAECYDAAQARLEPKAGKIVVQMHLSGEPGVGTLIDAAEIEGDAHFTKDAELVECLQQTMLSVELPPMDEGGKVDVTYPIEFAP